MNSCPVFRGVRCLGLFAVNLGALNVNAASCPCRSLAKLNVALRIQKVLFEGGVSQNRSKCISVFLVQSDVIKLLVQEF